MITAGFVKAKRPVLTMVMYIVGGFIGLIGIAVMVSNVLLFKATVAQYIAQGFPSSQVTKQLIPSQLLPGIFQPIAIYGGIALILFVSGVIYQKISQCLTLLTKAGVIQTGDMDAEDMPDQSPAGHPPEESGHEAVEDSTTP